METKQITTYDIAKLAGVSQTAVSKILNKKDSMIGQKTRERVLQIIKEQNYQRHFFASSLKSGKTNIVGVTTFDGDLGKFTEPYAAEVYQGIGTYFSQHNIKLVFENFQDMVSIEAMQNLAESKLVDGLIIQVYSRDLKKIRGRALDQLAQSNIPFVIVHSISEDLGCTSVGLNCLDGGLVATNHMIEHGYTEFGSVSLSYSAQHCEDLMSGHRNALSKSNFMETEGFSLTVSEPHYKNGYNLAQELINNKTQLPRAWFVVYEPIASGMIIRFREEGIRIPEDIAIISFGDEYKDRIMCTGISTIKQPGFEKGTKAAALLHEKMKGEKVESYIFEPELVLNTSCGCEKVEVE